MESVVIVYKGFHLTSETCVLTPEFSKEHHLISRILAEWSGFSEMIMKGRLIQLKISEISPVIVKMKLGELHA